MLKLVTILILGVTLAKQRDYKFCMIGHVASLEMTIEQSLEISVARQRLHDFCINSSQLEYCLLHGKDKKNPFDATDEMRNAHEKLAEKCRDVCKCSGVKAENSRWLKIHENFK